MILVNFNGCRFFFTYVNDNKKKNCPRSKIAIFKLCSVDFQAAKTLISTEIHNNSVIITLI